MCNARQNTLTSLLHVLQVLPIQVTCFKVLVTYLSVSERLLLFAGAGPDCQRQWVQKYAAGAECGCLMKSRSYPRTCSVGRCMCPALVLDHDARLVTQRVCMRESQKAYHVFVYLCE